MVSRSCIVLAGLVVVAIAFSPNTAVATTTIWVGNDLDLWENDNDWDNHVPTAAVDAVLDGGSGPYTYMTWVGVQPNPVYTGYAKTVTLDGHELYNVRANLYVGYNERNSPQTINNFDIFTMANDSIFATYPNSYDEGNTPYDVSTTIWGNLQIRGSTAWADSGGDRSPDPDDSGTLTVYKDIDVGSSSSFAGVDAGESVIVAAHRVIVDSTSWLGESVGGNEAHAIGAYSAVDALIRQQSGVWHLTPYWNFSGTLDIDRDMTCSLWNDGTDTYDAAAMTVGSGNTLSGDHTLKATLGVTNNGTVSPGWEVHMNGTTQKWDFDGVNATGTLTIDGEYTQGSGGNLKIEVASASSYDKLVITDASAGSDGTFTADGTLTVSVLDSFAPSLGDSFDVLDFVSLSGTFDTIVVPDNLSSPFRHWYTSRLYTQGILDVGSYLADMNRDGAVNALDQSIFQNRLIYGIYQIEGDMNHDGLLNSLDISGFVSCITYGGCGTGSLESSVVPEPASAFLVLLGAAACLKRR